jgi:hypothetical protein
VKIDSEGSAKATESKKRLLGPALAILVATKSMDNDYGKANAAGTAASNPAGQTLGGFSGFGLLGIAAAHTSTIAGSALGMYGMAWSVFNSIISRGREVEFDKNTSMLVHFGARLMPKTARR